MSLMCSLMDNDLDEELVKDNHDPAKNKKIYTRIEGSIAGEATKLVKTVKKGDGVAAYKVLENAFGNKRQLQVVHEVIAVISNTRNDETMDKYLRNKRDKIKDIEDACGEDYEKMWTLAKCATVIKNVNHEKLTESLLVNIATDQSKGVKLNYTALESTIQTFSNGLKITGNGGNDEKKKDEKEKVALKADEEKPKKKWKPKGGKFGGRRGGKFGKLKVFFPPSRTAFLNGGGYGGGYHGRDNGVGGGKHGKFGGRGGGKFGGRGRGYGGQRGYWAYTVGETEEGTEDTEEEDWGCEEDEEEWDEEAWAEWIEHCRRVEYGYSCREVRARGGKEQLEDASAVPSTSRTQASQKK